MMSEIKIPKTLGACADLLYATREQRYKIQKQIKELEELESAIENHFIGELPASDSTGVAGKVARVRVEQRDTPTIENWDEFTKFVAKHKRFDMIQRRLNASSIVEIWDDGKEVKGVKHFIHKKVFINKL